MIARLVAIAAGVWLMFSPAVLGYGDPAAVNDRIFGPIGASFAFVAIWEVVRSLRWGTLPVGAWLVLAPFVLGYSSTDAIVSSVVAGIAMALSALLGGEIRESYGGGWLTLLPDRDVPPAGVQPEPAEDRT